MVIVAGPLPYFLLFVHNDFLQSYMVSFLKKIFAGAKESHRITTLEESMADVSPSVFLRLQ